MRIRATLSRAVDAITSGPKKALAHSAAQAARFSAKIHRRVMRRAARWGCARLYRAAALLLPVALAGWAFWWLATTPTDGSGLLGVDWRRVDHFCRGALLAAGLSALTGRALSRRWEMRRRIL